MGVGSYEKDDGHGGVERDRDRVENERWHGPPLPQQKEYRQGTILEKVLQNRQSIHRSCISSVGVIVGWWFRRGRTKDGRS
jgi:hypothetical protein